MEYKAGDPQALPPIKKRKEKRLFFTLELGGGVVEDMLKNFSEQW